MAEGERQDMLIVLHQLISGHWSKIGLIMVVRQLISDLSEKAHRFPVFRELITDRQARTQIILLIRELIYSFFKEVRIASVFRKSIDGQRRALVLGEPGSDKTTGLGRLILDLAKKGSQRLGFGCLMPILVRLGNFHEKKLLDYVAHAMRHGTKRSSGKVLSKGIEKLLEQGHVVLLFDALDEALGERREVVLAELDDFLKIRAFANVPVVITSRTRQDPGERLKGLQIFEIQDLSDEAVSVFICAYQQPDDSEKEIWNRLQELRLLERGGLGRNPFWLRLIVESRVFIGNKGQILNNAVNTLLAREWEKPAVTRSWARILPKDEQLEETKRALAWLGYWMSVGNLITIEQDTALTGLKGWLKGREQVGAQGLRPQDILGLGRDAQVLIYQPGIVRFQHRLLQEFFTAWMMKIENDLLNNELERCTRDTAWWETLFLLGGLISKNDYSYDYSQFVQKVIGNGTNDQQIFAAIGLLRSIENPPGDLTDKVIKTFAASLTNKLTPNQISAVRELGRILGDEAAEIFGILFHDSDSLNKIKGAALLCALRSKRANEILLTAIHDINEHRTTIEILNSLGPLAKETLNTILSAIEPIIPSLIDEDKSESQYLKEAIANLGPIAIQYLITILQNSEFKSRYRAARALGNFSGPSVIDPLINALHDPHPLVRWHAGEALKEIADHSVVEQLISILHNRDTYICRLAVELLGRIADQRAVEPLIIILHHPDVEVRCQAIDALGKISDARAADYLINALHSLKLEVREHAIQALVKIGAPTIPSLIIALHDQDTDVRELVADVLAKIGISAVPSLITALNDSDPYVRKQAAEALGKIGDTSAIEPLISTLQDQDEDVRVFVAVALGKFYDARAVDPLIKALYDSDRHVRICVANSLGKIGDSRALPELERLAREDDGVTFWGVNVAETAQMAAEEIRQRMASVRSAEQAGKEGL